MICVVCYLTILHILFRIVEFVRSFCKRKYSIRVLDGWIIFGMERRKIREPRQRFGLTTTVTFARAEGLYIGYDYINAKRSSD